jgi:hypothetical protein
MCSQTSNPFLPLMGVLLALQLSGCATGKVAKAALRLEESTLEVRSLQTRTIAAPSEIAILTATIALLQDLEFNIDSIEKPLGVISASKISDADHKGEKTALFFLDFLCVVGSVMGGGGGSCDSLSTAKDEQALMLTMVVLPSLARQGEYAVRVTLQRIIYDKEGRIKVLQRVAKPEIYQEVFDKLRSALFIEVNES